MRKNIIGKKITVTQSKNKNLIGITGTIIDETKNLLTIKNQKDTQVKIIKEQATIKMDGTVTTIQSKKISERIKVKK